MVVSQLCRHTSARRTLDESFHDEERFVDFFHGSCVLADGSGNRRQPDGTAAEFVDDGQQDLVVYLIQSILVDVQCFQGNLSD